MPQDHIAKDGLLVLPHLRIQNANAISSPLTHGFPSMTAFIGFMWALERRLSTANIHLGLEAVGVVCHSYEEQTTEGDVRKEQTTEGDVRTFKLNRNPVLKNGEAASIVEEGRMHLDITLIFSVFWKNDSERSVLLQDMAEEREQMCQRIAQCVSGMRVAGGSVVSIQPTARLIPIAADPEQRVKDFRNWRRRWLPGFTLVSREDLLHTRLKQLQTDNPDATVLDALLDLSRFNHHSEILKNGDVKWTRDRPEGTGWIVPIPIGYTALSPLHAPNAVRNTRDPSAPFRFVESLYSIGEWLSPHRLADVDKLLWQPDLGAEDGLYRLRNSFHPSPTFEETRTQSHI